MGLNEFEDIGFEVDVDVDSELFVEASCIVSETLLARFRRDVKDCRN